MKLGNYITGKWIEGDGDGQQLYNAVNGEIIANATTKGLDFASILNYGRTTGKYCPAKNDLPAKRPDAESTGPSSPGAKGKILYA